MLNFAIRMYWSSVDRTWIGFLSQFPAITKFRNVVVHWMSILMQHIHTREKKCNILWYLTHQANNNPYFLRLLKPSNLFVYKHFFLAFGVTLSYTPVRSKIPRGNSNNCSNVSHLKFWRSVDEQLLVGRQVCSVVLKRLSSSRSTNVKDGRSPTVKIQYNHE